MTCSKSSEDNCGAASSLIVGASAGAIDVDDGDDCDDEAYADAGWHNLYKAAKRLWGIFSICEDC